MKILIYIDNLIDTFYKAHNDYPSKIKMTLEKFEIVAPVAAYKVIAKP